MKNVMGVINLAGEHGALKELTQFRCPASVPFGARYRMIDFILSNMVNSGIHNIGVFALDKYRSLLEHVGTGADWDLDRNKDGLFIFPPALDINEGGYKGDIHNFYSNLDYFYKSTQEDIIMSGSICIYNTNFSEIYEAHKLNGADITIMYKDNVCMDVYIFKKSIFIDLVEMTRESNDFMIIKDAILANIPKLKTLQYSYDGYAAMVNSLENYYIYSLDLLQSDVYKELFLNKRPIYTKTQNKPPAKYMSNSEVRNSLLADGCQIDGIVENSILFRGVNVHPGAVVKNSIIMSGCEIGKYAVIENCILDKEVRIAEKEILKGDKYTVFGKRSVI